MSKEQHQPIIVQTPGTCGGRARIDGSRISVRNVVEAYEGFLRSMFIQQYVQEHPQLDPHEVQAALNYYDEHRTEIDQEIADERELSREHGQLML